MVNPKQISGVLDVLEFWVRPREVRSALLLDLLRTPAALRNKSFRDTLNALVALHAARHLTKKEE